VEVLLGTYEHIVQVVGTTVLYSRVIRIHRERQMVVYFDSGDLGTTRKKRIDIEVVDLSLDDGFTLLSALQRICLS
jgi:hypothetical protein